MRGGLRELDLRTDYRTDADDLPRDFYIPALERCTMYRRAVGYFTSYGIATAANGIRALCDGSGEMRLVTSPMLSEEDVDAIERGYEARENAVERAVLNAIAACEDSLWRNRLEWLAWLVAESRLTIRLATPTAQGLRGIYHEKVGVFTDGEGNAVTFIGSPNETAGGLIENFESIEVFWSWEDPQGRVQRKIDHFERLWANQTRGLVVLPFPDAARQQLLRHYVRGQGRGRQNIAVAPASPLGPALWPHQRRAIDTFLERPQGVLEMATGTGKTRVAQEIIRALHEKGRIHTVIVAADGNDLLDQWHGHLLALHRAVPTFRAVLREYEDNHDADRVALFDRDVLVLSSRLALPRILRTMSRAQTKATLVVHDEIHRLGSQGNREALAPFASAEFRLGLSATPDRVYDQEGNDFIETHVGPLLFQFPLDAAIAEGILCEFDYHPLSYFPSDDDRHRIQSIFARASAREAIGDPMSDEELWIELSKVHKTSKEKLPVFDEIVRSQPQLLNRCIVFVETREYGEQVLEIIHRYTHDFHTYYATEDRQTLRRFAQGHVACLLTCHRLSEGIDIRGLESVVLFSSARARLETIQRIGRCLRVDPSNPNKRAHVVDFIRHDMGTDDKWNADVERHRWLEAVATTRREEVSTDA